MACLLSAVVISSVSIAGSAETNSALENSEDVSFGCLGFSRDKNAIEEHSEAVNVGSGNSINSTTALPSSVDLSTSPCFPKIGNQGLKGSCASFASTYYQYSYEVNKLNNVTSTEDRVTYSPQWTYGLICQSTSEDGSGSFLAENYDILENFGALTIEDLPYMDDTDSSLYVPPHLDNEKRKALHTRLTSYTTHIVDTNDKISSPNDSNPGFRNVKALLASGKVLTVVTRFDYDCHYVPQLNTSIVYRCAILGSGGGGAHALTVVGYNDNISYDVNGNGTIESYEKGAFKIANSWGNEFHGYGVDSYTGYFWVLYDALNTTSANTLGSWEDDLPGIRISAFSPELATDNRNVFTSIEVAKKTPYIIGRLDCNVAQRLNFDLRIKRAPKSVNSWTSENSQFIPTFNIKCIEAFNGCLFFDFENFCTPISNYINGYNWQVSVNSSSNSDSVSITLEDNLSEKLSNNKPLVNSSSAPGRKFASVPLSFIKGDANYDGKLTQADIDIVVDHYKNKTELSNLKFYLADYNDDGKVSMYDASLILTYINAHS